MRVAILAPDGVGLRNFVLGPLLGFLEEVLVVHDMPGDAVRSALNGQHENAALSRVFETRDRRTSFALRQTLAYAHLYWADTHSMRYTRARKAVGSWRMRCAQTVAKRLGRLGATESGVSLIEHAYFSANQRMPEVQRYMELLERHEASVLFCTNQRSRLCLLPVLAARKLGIPSVTFIGSWDNLTSKSRIAAPFDYYLVWSEHMQQELLRYYPRIAKRNVRIVGTPQFDCYADQSLLYSRDEFLRSIGADPSRPLICYSGGDEGTCPEDQLHVRTLMTLIRQGRIRKNPQVVLRPCPVDPGTRYDAVRKEFPELIYAKPDWPSLDGQDWARCMPTLNDVRMLCNLTEHADLGINIASTMTLDFGLHDRPVVNIAYDQTSPPPLRVPLWDLFYSWEHYQPVVQLQAARFAHSANDLAEMTNLYLDDPTLDREGRRRLAELQINVPVGASSKRIATVLEEIAGLSERQFVPKHGHKLDTESLGALND